MVRQAVILSGLLFAFGILFISLFRSNAADFSLSPAYKDLAINNKKNETSFVSFPGLPYPGLLPDSPLWPLNAAKDRIWLFLTRDHIKKANLLRLLADERIGMAYVLAQKNKVSLSISVAMKAEKYLKESYEEQKKAEELGINTKSLLLDLAESSSRHTKVLESIKELLPDSARSSLDKVIDFSKMVHQEITHKL
jgi:hypothetical protein